MGFKESRSLESRVLSSDGSTNTTSSPSAAIPTNSSTPISSVLSTTRSEVPILHMTAVSPTYTSTNDAQYEIPLVPVAPVVFGIVGGIIFLLVLLFCALLAMRRPARGNMLLVSVTVRQQIATMLKSSRTADTYTKRHKDPLRVRTA